MSTRSFLVRSVPPIAVALLLFGAVGCGSDDDGATAGNGSPLSVDAGNGGEADTDNPAAQDPANSAALAASSSIAAGDATQAGVQATSDTEGGDTLSGGQMQGNRGSNVAVNQAGETTVPSAVVAPGATPAAQSAMEYGRVLAANLQAMSPGRASLDAMQQAAKLVRAPAIVNGMSDGDSDGLDDDAMFTITTGIAETCVRAAPAGWVASEGSC